MESKTYYSRVAGSRFVAPDGQEHHFGPDGRLTTDDPLLQKELDKLLATGTNPLVFDPKLAIASVQNQARSTADLITQMQQENATNAQRSAAIDQALGSQDENAEKLATAVNAAAAKQAELPLSGAGSISAQQAAINAKLEAVRNGGTVSTAATASNAAPSNSK